MEPRLACVVRAGVCVAASLRGVTSKWRVPRERVPRGVPPVWSVYISRVPPLRRPHYFSRFGLPCCTDSCRPPSTNALLYTPAVNLPFLLSPLSSIILCVCVCWCVYVCVSQLWFWPRLSFVQGTAPRRGGGGICSSLIGTSYWLRFTGSGPDPSHWEDLRLCPSPPESRIR